VVEREGRTDMQAVVQLFDFGPKTGQIFLWYGTITKRFQILFDSFNSPDVFRNLLRLLLGYSSDKQEILLFQC
jgi:hypothetical protein